MIRKKLTGTETGWWVVSSGGRILLPNGDIQLAEFYRSHHYCGYCGNKMIASLTEWACLCSH